MRRREVITLLDVAAIFPAGRNRRDIRARAQQLALQVVGFLRDATAGGRDLKLMIRSIVGSAEMADLVGFRT
jgi:hypothetical protein